MPKTLDKTVVVFSSKLYFKFTNFCHSCDAIAEEDEDVELEMKEGLGIAGDAAAMSEERKAAALRIIRRAKRAGMARERAYSTSEGGPDKFGSILNGTHGPNQRSGGKNSRKSRSGFGRGLPKKGDKFDPESLLKVMQDF